MVKAASVDAAHWTWGVGVGSAESDESKKSMDFYKWKLHSNNINDMGLLKNEVYPQRRHSNGESDFLYRIWSVTNICFTKSNDHMRISHYITMDDMDNTTYYVNISIISSTYPYHPFLGKIWEKSRYVVYVVSQVLNRGLPNCWGNGRTRRQSFDPVCIPRWPHRRRF